MIVLHGDQRGDAFEAHLYIHSFASIASAHLYTTERPVAGEKGAARFPLTVRVVRQVMGADAERVFGNKLAIALPPAAAGGGQGAGQTAGPAAAAAATASSSAAAGEAIASPSQQNADLVGAPSVNVGVASPHVAAPAAGGDGSCGGNRGEKRKAVALSASIGDNGEEGDTAADGGRAQRRRREQTARGAEDSSMTMGDE